MRRISSWLVVLLMAVVMAMAPSPSQADTGCVVNTLGIKICGELLGLPSAPVITVTVPPVPIEVPGPTVTVTAVPPPVTVTTTVPGPGQTVTVTEPAAQGPTPDSVPGPSTETVTVSPAGQDPVEGGTIVDNTPRRPPIDFGDGTTTIVEAGIGVLTLLALVGLLLLTMYSGYIVGYKDHERKDTNFMRALLDTVKSR